MSARAAAALAGVLAGTVTAGCVRDDFHCQRDEQCNLGDAIGRCEVNGRCTIPSDLADCASGREYTEHSGDMSGACYDDRRTPTNLCMEGQPPALPDTTCTAQVCAAVPSCCESGWSSACVQEAQARCALACDTFVALTVHTSQLVSPTGVQLWDVRHVDGTWTARQLPAGHGAFYLAPAPGKVQPRLARIVLGADHTELYIDDAAPIRLPARTYTSVASVDYDRDGRDVIALSSRDAGVGYFELRDLASPDVVTRDLAGADFYGAMAWGDYNDDAYPDVAFALDDAADHAYRVVQNLPHAAPATILSMSIPAGDPAIRQIQWGRYGGDGLIDLLVSGNRVHLHTPSLLPPSDTFAPITNTIDHMADCEVPLRKASCPGDNPDASYVATFRPDVDEGAIVAATIPKRGVWAVRWSETEDEATNNIAMPTPLPTAPCPSGCLPLIALTARELDTGGLDLIGFDTSLRLWTTSETSQLLTPQTVTPLIGDSTHVEISVGGRPRGDLSP